MYYNNVSFAESLIPFLVCERQGCWHITWKIFVKLYIWCLHPIPMEKLANFSPLKALTPPPQRAPLQKEADFIKVCRLKWQPWEGTQLYLYIHVAPSFIYLKELDIDCGVLEMSCWALWGVLRYFEVLWATPLKCVKMFLQRTSETNIWLKFETDWRLRKYEEGNMQYS